MTPNICIACSAAVPDLPGLDPSRPTCSTQCAERARVAAMSRLLREVTS